jgi:predicted CoA-binding protein
MTPKQLAARMPGAMQRRLAPAFTPRDTRAGRCRLPAGLSPLRFSPGRAGRRGGPSECSVFASGLLYKGVVAARDQEVMIMPVTDHNVTQIADRIRRRCRVFAIVGASPDPTRPGHRVMRVLQIHGYRVIPVNPHVPEVRGLICHPDLASIPDGIEIDAVDIFRLSEAAGRHVHEAIAVGTKAVWMQLGGDRRGRGDPERRAGLDVVMDRCPAIDLARRETGRTT